MRRILFFVYLTGLCLLHLQANAQLNNTGSNGLRVGNMTDQQLLQFWQQSQRSGMSEADGISMLVRRGMDPSEVNNFKQRLLQLNQANSKSGKPSIVRDTTNFLSDSTWVKEIPALVRKNRNFGYQFFNNLQPLLQPNLRIATPKNYVLGPGDELSITLTGINIKEIATIVTAEGSIQLDYVGLTTVSGLTIDQATQKIKNKLSAIYPAIKSGGTQMYVTLGRIRSIRVTVVGEAEIVGDFVISGLASITNVLYLSGGPSENGSLRNIELIRNNKVFAKLDFYQFLLNGTFDQNVRLEDGDIIRYPLYEKRVVLSGEVKRPFIFEMKEKETFSDLLLFGGGFTEYAIKDVAKIVQPNERDYSMRDLPAKDFSYFIPKNGDSVYFDKLTAGFQNKIVLTGAVYRPGNYELTTEMTLSGLLKKADGPTPEAFLNRAVLMRQLPDGEPTMIAFNVNDILSGKQKDIMLMRNDSIRISHMKDLRELPTVTIAGAVRKSGTFVYREGMLLEDIILMAGGFTNDAANHKVEISRLEKNKADTLANQLLDVMTVSVDSALYEAGAKTTLKPLDYIFVPRLLNYRNLGSIKVRGEVLYAGDYALERRNETVQEVIERAGGISPYASLADVQVFRKGLRVATTLLSDNKDQRKFLLQPGDSVHIPRNEPFVEIMGAVFNPQILSYQNGSFMSYISSAGGVTDNGNLKKAYIQYSNGISKKINRFLFFRSYPKVLPGSKIIVPEKTGNERKGLNIIELSAITGSLSALISLISVLK